MGKFNNKISAEFHPPKKWILERALSYQDENIDVDFDKCVSNKSIEDYILNGRIEAVKKFKLNATPTIIINNEKFDKTLNFKNLKKSIEKLI